MSYRLEHSEDFIRDYTEALGYIAGTLKNPIAAHALDDAFEAAKPSLTEFPFIAEPFMSSAGEAYYPLTVKNYVAYYVVVDDTVEFRRFLYGPSDISKRIEP